MARPRKIGPDRQELESWKDEGLTQQQMADRATEKYHERWVRWDIANRFREFGMSATRERYPDALPWKVKTGHSSHYPAMMLRAAERRERELPPLNEEEPEQLDAWLKRTKDDNVVWGYFRDDGFVRVDRSTVPREYVHPRYPIIPADAYPLIRQKMQIGAARQTVDGVRRRAKAARQ